MRSGDFDTYLAISAAEGEFSAVVEDDDGLGQGTDPRLNFTLPATGDYVVRARPYAPDTKGLYSIEFDRPGTGAGGRQHPDRGHGAWQPDRQ